MERQEPALPALHVGKALRGARLTPCPPHSLQLPCCGPSGVGCSPTERRCCATRPPWGAVAWLALRLGADTQYSHNYLWWLWSGDWASLSILYTEVIYLSQWMPEGKYIHTCKGSHAALEWDVINSTINYSYSFGSFPVCQGSVWSNYNKKDFLIWIFYRALEGVLLKSLQQHEQAANICLSNHVRSESTRRGWDRTGRRGPGGKPRTNTGGACTVCVLLSFHYLLFIFDRNKVKLGLSGNFQAQLRLTHRLLRQQAFQMPVRSFCMQTHTGRDGGQVLRAWYSKLSIAKVSQASGLCVTNYRALQFNRQLGSTAR